METPNNEQANMLRVRFSLQKMLGMETKRFNLINIKREGDYFSSSDDRMNLVKYLQVQENIPGLGLFYLIKTKDFMENDDAVGLKFYMIVNNSGSEENRTAGGRRCVLEDTAFVSGIM